MFNDTLAHGLGRYARAGLQREEVLTLHEIPGCFKFKVRKVPNVRVKDIDEKLYLLPREKARSQRTGPIVTDFDLLIGHCPYLQHDFGHQ